MIRDIKLTINGVEIPNDQYTISERISDNRLTGKHTIAVNTDLFSHDRSGERLEHQLEALSWLQGKTSNEFVLGWIAMHKESMRRAGGTPEK